MRLFELYANVTEVIDVSIDEKGARPFRYQADNINYVFVKLDIISMLC